MEDGRVSYAVAVDLAGAVLSAATWLVVSIRFASIELSR
jgi:hypothetical protein